MVTRPTRRRFLKIAASSGAAFSFGNLSFLDRLPRLSAAEAALPTKFVQFTADIEPLVRFLEETPRDRLLEETATRIHRGLSYQEIIAALFLAGIRNIQPRPVGFKFHSVLVVNSAHLASIASPDSDRWLPLFWALDSFKSAQAQDVKEGDWTMAAPAEPKVPGSGKAKAAFIAAMDHWDEAGADAAITGLARTAGTQEIFELLCRYGARDFREIGHKAIYVANSWRLLNVIGWRHAEPVLRSLAYALLDRGGDRNPAENDLAPDRPWRANLHAVAAIRPDWPDGKPSVSAAGDLLETLRHASTEEASKKVVALLNGGVAAQSVWDGIFQAAAELMVRRPGILSLHAVTSTNALHYAFQTSANDETRRLLMLQNAAFLTLFRGDGELKSIHLADLAPAAGSSDSTPKLEEIFSEISRDRTSAARKLTAYLRASADLTEFSTAARRQVFLKGTNAHDYKFSSAVLEDFLQISPQHRDAYLACSAFYLRGSGEPDNTLVKRTRAALA